MANMTNEQKRIVFAYVMTIAPGLYLGFIYGMSVVESYNYVGWKAILEVGSDCLFALIATLVMIRFLRRYLSEE